MLPDINLLTISMGVCIIVFFAMCIDLMSGLYKAKQRGDFRTSSALKRSLTKFISYEGGLIIAIGIDILLDYSRLQELLGLGVLVGVPVITCAVGMFLLFVEFLSVREKADEKLRKEEERAAKILSNLLGDEKTKDAVLEIIKHKATRDD